MNAGEAPAPEHKAKEVQALLDEGFDPDLFIDNDPANREAVAALGVDVADPADLDAESEAAEEESDEEEEAVEMSAKALVYSKAGNTKMTIEDKLSTAELLAQALTSERDDLRATVEKLTVGATAELESLKVEAAAKDASIASLTEALKASEAALAESLAKVSELEAVKASASKEAAKIVASFGTEPVELPKGDSPKKMSAEDIKAAYLALPAGQARIAFFNAHKAALIS